MNYQTINSLKDLNLLRSAPVLNSKQIQILSYQLSTQMALADWFTIGIMAPSKVKAILTIREIEEFFKWEKMTIAFEPEAEGPVFLKANQKTGDIYIRIEYGLGEGILVTCQNNEKDKSSETLGPFPLNFFKILN